MRNIEAESWLRDTRLALRGLLRQKATGVGVLIILALGVGIDLVTFQLVDQLLLQPPAHLREPARLVRAALVGPDGGSATLSYPAYEALGADSEAFAGAAGYVNTNLSSPLVPSRDLRVTLVTADYFATLGTSPILGRLFGRDHGDPPDEPVAVLSYGLWASAFGSSRGVIGKVVRFGRRDFTVVGVVPKGFSGTDRERVEAWLPLGSVAPDIVGSDWRFNHASAFLRTVFRLRPGVPRHLAESRATARYRALLHAAGLPQAVSVQLSKLNARAGQDHERLLKVAAVLGALALLIYTASCANVANVLFARSIARRHELGARLAVGADPGALARLAFVEAVVTTVPASVAAAAAASVGTTLVHTRLLPDLTWTVELSSQQVLLFALGLAGLTALWIGLILALTSRRLAVESLLRSQARTARWRSDVRQSALVVAQVAALVVLLSGAGTFFQTFRNVRNMEVGFDTESVVVVEFDISGLSAPEVAALYERAREPARLAGASQVALATAVPFRRSNATYFRASGADSIPRLPTGGPYLVGVDSNYFAAVGAKLLVGQVSGFGQSTEARTVIVNETMARRVWGRLGVLGECLWIADDADCRRIVGVVKDQKRDRLTEGETMEAYVPLSQAPSFLAYRALFARAEGSGSSLVAPLRRALSAISAGAPYPRVNVLSELIDPQLRAWRLATTAFGVHAFLALLVGTTGLYSVVTLSFARRRRELAVRLALGARAPQIAFGFLGGSLRDAAIGMLAGLVVIVLGWPKVAPAVVGISLPDALGLGCLSGMLVVATIVGATAQHGLAVIRRELALTLAEV